MDISREQYLKERLEEQISWYDTRSSCNQKTYKYLKRIEVVLAAAIPLLSGLTSDFPILPIIVGAFGATIAVIEGFLSIGKYHENWIEYRSICETLRHEKYMYLTKTGVYNGSDPFTLLVERIESVISKENVNWAVLNVPNYKGEVKS